MKNPMIYYAAIAIGVIALVAGAILFTTATSASPHHISAPAAIAVGLVLLIAGVAGMFVMKPKATAK